MKKIKWLFLLPVFAFTFPGVKEVKIKGTMQLNRSVEWVFLSYRTTDATVTDSTQLYDGKFKFKENIDGPVLALLSVRYKSSQEEKPVTDRIQIFIEPGKMEITVKDSLKFAKVTRSKSHEEFEAINEMMKPYSEKMEGLNEQYMKFYRDKNEAGMKEIQEKAEVIQEDIKEKVYHTYLTERPNSPIGLYALKQYSGYDLDPAKVEPLYEKLPAAIKNSSSGIAFKEQIETAKKTGIGVYAMDFTQNDTLGNPVSLSSFKGKYVLLDFWASWCGPCRAENPNVVKAFNTYKDKGFTVLGVSLDQPGKKEAWLNAIHKDNLTWTHVSDLNFWNNAVAKQYGIQAIPQNFLLDPSGKIIAKNVRGDELVKKLEEIF